MITELSREDRVRLLRFVCSFAWADLKVQDQERQFLGALVKKLGLSRVEADMVDAWLLVPPRPEEVDPMEIPRQHREVFLRTVRELIEADEHIAQGEFEFFELFEQLIV